MCQSSPSTRQRPSPSGMHDWGGSSCRDGARACVASTLSSVGLGRAGAHDQLEGLADDAAACGCGRQASCSVPSVNTPPASGRQRCTQPDPAARSPGRTRTSGASGDRLTSPPAIGSARRTGARRSSRRCARPRRGGRSASHSRDQLGVLDHVVPALGREGVGADQEAVGEFEEDLAPAPGRPCRPRAWSVRKARSHHRFAVLAQHLAHLLRRSRSRSAPTGCAPPGPGGTGARWPRRRSASAGTGHVRAPAARPAEPPAGRRRRRRRGTRRSPRSGGAPAATRGA